FGAVFLHALEQVHAKLAMAEFTTAETQRDLHLVTFADELVNRLHLRLIIMIVDVRTHFDLLDLLRLLALASEVRLFLRLVLGRADVQIFGDGRIGVGRYFDQVETQRLCLLHRLTREHHAQILTLMVDDADLGRLDEFVEPRAGWHRGRETAPGHGRTYR